MDHFILDHVIEVPDSEADYAGQSGQDKLNKRKTREVQRSEERRVGKEC